VPERLLFDTSAILTLLRDEAGAGKVEELLARRSGRDRLLLAPISLTETYYIVWQAAGQTAARETMVRLKTLPLTIVAPTERIALAAGRLKALHRLSLADAVIAATAAEYRATLVHKDPEYLPLAGQVRLLNLPFKKRGPRR